jgi:hypothetical protein
MYRLPPNSPCQVGLKPHNYEKDEKQKELFEKCHHGISTWICNSCHAKLKRTEMPPAAIANGLDLCQSVEELNCLNDIEHALICQVLPFMSIVARHRGAQSGLKGQVVLVPTDLTKLQKVLPRSCNEDHLISVALKRRLTDNSAYIKQHISPAKINAALMWLKENNPLYSHIQFDENWEKTMQESDPELWSMLTEDATSSNDKKLPDLVSDSDTDDESSDKTEKEQIHQPGIPYPSVIQNAHGPDISVEDIVEIAPAEGKIPISRNMVPDCEALAFPGLFGTGEFHLNSIGEKKSLL